MSQIQETFLFTPTSVPGCQLWLDGADPSTLSLSGSSVTEWRDKSGNGFNFTASSTGLTYASNAILFVDNNFMSNASITTFQNANTLFLILKATGINASGIGMIFSYGDNGTTDTYGYRILAPGIGTSSSYSWDVNPPGNGGNINFNGNATLYVNGVTGTSNTYSIYNQAILSAPGNGGIAAGNGTVAGLTLSRSALSRFYNGYTYEVILYNSQLNTNQRQQVEGYLAWKWGLQGSLPSNHPFKTYRPLANTPIPTSVPPMPLVTQGRTVFLPTQISGCIMWLDAADRSTLFQDSGGLTPVTAQGQSIGLWRDKSARGYVLTVPSGKTAPTYGPNVINTTGTNALWSTTNFELTGNAKLTLFFVFASSVASGFNSSCSATIGNPNAPVAGKIIGIGIGVQGTTTEYIYNVPLTFAESSLSTTQPRLVGVTTLTSAKYDGSSVFGSYNGTPLAPFGALAAGGANWSSLPFQTGSRYANAGSSVDGFMCEVICYNDSLTDAQVQQVEGYLAWKWGLQSSLPVGYPYKQQPIAPFPFTATPFRGGLNQWQPLQVSGCRVWLDGADASTITLTGSAVTQWRDKSGSANNYTNNGTLTYSNRGVSFPGSSFMQNTSLTGFPFGTSPSLTTFIIFAYTNVNSTRGLFSYGNVTCSKTGYVVYADNGGSLGNLVLGTLYCGDLNVNGRVTANTITMVSDVVTYTGVSGSLTRAGFTNGGPMDNLPTNSTTGVNLTSSGSSRLGDAAGGYLLGTMYEVLFYSASLSTAQRQQVEGYLAWKWGLQGDLPSSHPFKRWPPPP
jgi:hypothetical protein